MPRAYTVAEGDTLISIAERFGLFAETIWKHHANAALRERRESMYFVLSGDELIIPDKAERHEQIATGRRHRFVRKGIPAIFRTQLFRFGLPYANQPYRLVSGARAVSGTTDGDGVLEEFVDPGPGGLTLFAGPDDLRLDVRFGDVGPVDELHGVQQRLKNLGLFDGPLTGRLGKKTSRAIAAFQQRVGRAPTGTLDDETRRALAAAHDQVAGAPAPSIGPPKPVPHG